MTLTYEMAMAAAHDAGNTSMRKAGRTKWDVEDWNIMCRTFDEIWRPHVRFPERRNTEGTT
jgi:hypothetical protein